MIHYEIFHGDQLAFVAGKRRGLFSLHRLGEAGLLELRSYDGGRLFIERYELLSMVRSGDAIPCGKGSFGRHDALAKLFDRSSRSESHLELIRKQKSRLRRLGMLRHVIDTYVRSMEQTGLAAPMGGGQKS